MNIIKLFKRGSQIRKMQTAAGGPIKKPIKRLKDGYRYIPDEQTGGWTRISDNSVADVFATMEFTPKKTKIGSSITRKQSAPSKTYYSAYNPDDIIKGFNALTLGGLNNLSPTQWVRRYYDLNQLLASQVPGTKRTMTWSGFVNNWLNGNNGLVSEKFAQEHPYWSMGINGVGDAVALGGIANASKVNLVGNIAAKHGGNATKIALDVAKNSSTPFNWKNYKFLGDSRFYSDLDDVGYKTLMSERKSGNYPLTFAERRNYITGLKNDIQEGVDFAINEARENVKVPLIRGKEVEYTFNGGSGWRLDPYTPEDILPLKIHYGTLKATNSKSGRVAPWEGNYGAFLNDSGLFFPFRDNANTLRTHSMFQDVGERVGTGAHETRHTIQSYFDTPLTEKRYDMPGSYGRYTNRELPLDFKKKVNSFISDAETAGEWQGSLSEMDAELTGWRALYNLPRYSEMNPKQKAQIYDLFQKRFGGNTDYDEAAFHLLDDSKILNPYAIRREVKKLDDSKIGQIILGLETLGYRKNGGKMNLIDFLKNGSGIHIKEENKGKFTSYCGGKVTNECILKGKNSSNPTIRKRATFAANARKWKHQFGGIIPGTNNSLDYKQQGVLALNYLLSHNPTAATMSQWVKGTLSYLTGIKDSDLIESKYRPSKASSKNAKYYTRKGLDYDVMRNLLGGKESKAKEFDGTPLYYKNFNDLYTRLSNLNGKQLRTTDNSHLGEYTIGIGQDKNGRYVSYYDKFDWAPKESLEIFSPYEIYNRIYEKDFNRMLKELNNETYSGSNPSGNWFFKSGINNKGYFKFGGKTTNGKHEYGGTVHNGIKKHYEGAKLTFGLKLGNFAKSDLGKSVISNGLSFLLDKLFNKSASSNLEIALAAQEKELPTIDPTQVALMIEMARNQYADPENPNANGGDIFNSYIKNQITAPILARQLEEHKKRLAAINLLMNQAKSSAVGTFFNTLAQGGIEYLLNKYGTTEKADRN